MREEGFIFKDPEGIDIFVYKWIPEETCIKGAVQISHGMAETAARYKRFAEALTKEGYIVYANDHRGHGNTAGSLENVGYCGYDGFNWMVKDMKQLSDIIRKENEDIPLFLLGHSMGSMLAQKFMTLYGKELEGVILSGTSGPQGIMLDFGIFIARWEVAKRGERAKSPMLNKLVFGSYNNAFKPNRTEFDWLTRDEKEVDKYIEDPFCGGIFSSGFFYDLFRGLKDIHREDNMRKIPKDLPIFVFSGQRDPVGKNCKTVIELIKIYKKLNIKDVTYKFYKDGRHEMLNEINREEVFQDVIHWLNDHLG